MLAVLHAEASLEEVKQSGQFLSLVAIAGLGEEIRKVNRAVSCE